MRHLISRLLVAVQVLGTLALLFFVFRNFDWNSFWGLLAQISPWHYAFWLLLLLAGQLLFVLKWKILLNVLGVKNHYPQLVDNYLIGLFFNNFLPTAFGGDLARIYYLGKSGQSYATVGLSVFLDRLIGLFATAAWAAVLLLVLDITTPALSFAKEILLLTTVGFLAGLLVLLFFPLKLIPRQWLKGSLGSYIESRLPKFQAMRQQLRSHPWALIAMIGLVLLYYLLVAVIYGDFFALMGASAINPLSLLVIVMSIAILSNIPVSVNGIGLREELHFLLFGAVGISKELAVSASLVVFSLMLLVSLVGLVAWVRGGGKGKEGEGSADWKRKEVQS